MISAAFTVNGSPNPAAHDVGFGTTVNLNLLSATGATSIVWSMVSCSDPDEALPTITTGGSPPGKTASFVMPADPLDDLGRTFLIKCVVSSETKNADGANQTAVEYGVIGASNVRGIMPIAPGEENYRHGTHGWAPEFNIALANSATGAVDGEPGGDTFRFNFSTSIVDADPTAGGLRLNNASPSSATKIFVDVLDTNGSDVTTWLDSLDDTAGSIKGRIRLYSVNDPSIYAVYNLTSIDTISGYRKLNVSHVSSSGTFSTAIGDLAFSFSPGGADGASGTIETMSVRVAVASNIALTGAAGTIDGVAVIDGDRVLCFAQTDAKQNGIYVVNTGGAWSRSTDQDSSAELNLRPLIFVQEGTLYRSKLFQLVNSGSVTLGSTDLDFDFTLYGPTPSVDFTGEFAAVTSNSDLNYGPIVFRDWAANATRDFKRTNEIVVNPSLRVPAADSAGNIHLGRGDAANIEDYPYNARSSTQTTTATGTSGTPNVAVASAIDFKARDGVVIIGGGSSESLIAPAAPVNTNQGTNTGTVTREYRLVGWNSDTGAMTPRSAALTVTVPDILGTADPLGENARVTCAVTVNVPDLTDVGRYLDTKVEVARAAGTTTKVILTAQTTTSQNGFYDVSVNQTTGKVSLVRNTSTSNHYNVKGAYIVVWNGMQMFTTWRVTSNPYVTLDVEPITLEKADVRLRPYGVDVTAVSTTNITLSGSQTIDGQVDSGPGASLINGVSLIGVFGQTTTSQNGIYVYNTAGAWPRATAWDDASELKLGTFVRVIRGNTYSRTTWFCTTAAATVGVDPIAFTQKNITHWIVYGGPSGTPVFIGGFLANPLRKSTVEHRDCFFIDRGRGAVTRPAWIPSSAPVSERAGFKRARLLSATGTALVLDSNLGTTVSGTQIYHDNYQAFVDAMAAKKTVIVPEGQYEVMGHLEMSSYHFLRGVGREASEIYFHCGYGMNVRTGAAYSTIKDLKFTTPSLSLPAGKLFVGANTRTPNEGAFHGAALFIQDRCHIECMQINSFVGSGCVLQARDTDSTNANETTFKDVYCGSNKGHGFYAGGSEANSLKWDCCSSISNDGAGILDSGFLGNTAIGCHTSTNDGPAYWVEDDTNPSNWDGCYSESGQGRSIRGSNSIAVGGTHGAGFESSEIGVAINGAGLNTHTTKVGFPEVTVQVGESGTSSRIAHMTSSPGLDHRIDQLGTDSIRFLFSSLFGGHTADWNGYNLKSSGLLSFARGFFLESGVNDGNYRRVLLVPGTTFPNGIYDIGDVLCDRNSAAFYKPLKKFTKASSAWSAGTARTKGSVIAPTGGGNTKGFVCTTAGTSHATTEPTWVATAPNIGDTITDGTAVWTNWGTFTPVEGTDYTVIGGKIEVLDAARNIGALAANASASYTVTVTGAKLGIHRAYAFPKADLGTAGDHIQVFARVLSDNNVRVTVTHDGIDDGTDGGTGGTPNTVDWIVGVERG